MQRGFGVKAFARWTTTPENSAWICGECSPEELLEALEINETDWLEDSCGKYDYRCELCGVYEQDMDNWTDLWERGL